MRAPITSIGTYASPGQAGIWAHVELEITGRTVTVEVDLTPGERFDTAQQADSELKNIAYSLGADIDAGIEVLPFDDERAIEHYLTAGCGEA